MKKSKISIKKIVRYVRDLSIVVAGIAVTMYVNDQITNKSEKRDLRLYLNAIVLELQENIKDIEEQIKMEQKSFGYAKYLNSVGVKSVTDVKPVSRDTVNSYIDSIYLVQSVTYKTNAFEMFKLSGTMRLMENKELILTIWKAYTNMDEVKNLVDMGYQFKLDEAKKEAELSFAERQKRIPMYTFYTQTGWTFEFQQHWKATIEMLKETIRQIEEVL